jgi:hypothetical protein
VIGNHSCVRARLHAAWAAGAIPISPGSARHRTLTPRRIKPKSIRLGDGTPKGYALGDLHDAFARYLPEPQQAQQAQRTEPPQADEPGDVADVADRPGMEASDGGEELADEDLERDLERLRAKFDFDGNLSA